MPAFLCPVPRGIPRFSFFFSPVSRSTAIFLVVASGWHPDIPPLIVLCPAPSLPEFSFPPLIVLCARVSRARFPSFISSALYAGYSFRLLRGASAPRDPFLGSYAGFNPAYCVSIYWFISLLLASSTVRISFALRTSTSRLFRMFCSPAIFLVVASGWHPDIPPPLGVLCPAPSLPEFSSPPLIVLCPAPSLPEFSSPPLGVLCARVSRARSPSSFVHCAGCYPAFLSSIPPFDGSRWSSLSRVV